MNDPIAVAEEIRVSREVTTKLAKGHKVPR
jgi:hypothetical protein